MFAILHTPFHLVRMSKGKDRRVCDSNSLILIIFAFELVRVFREEVMDGVGGFDDFFSPS